jgi:hypothetical protein
MTELELLQRKIKILREALQFYADPSRYEPQPDAYGHKQRPIMVYKWWPAQAALRLQNSNKLEKP